MSNGIPSDFQEEKKLFLDLDDSDETDVYLIRVPKGFDITKLHGTELCAGEIKEIGGEEGTSQLTSVYELGAFCGQGLDVLPVIKSGKTSTLGPPLEGFLSINKAYRANPTTSHVSDKLEPAAHVPMPEELKVRFQPFGAGMPFRQSSDATKTKKRKRKHSLDITASATTEDILHVKKKQKMHIESDTPHLHKKHKNKRRKSYFTFTVVL